MYIRSRAVSYQCAWRLHVDARSFAGPRARVALHLSVCPRASLSAATATAAASSCPGQETCIPVTALVLRMCRARKTVFVQERKTTCIQSG